jgi:hypothetical protein
MVDALMLAQAFAAIAMLMLCGGSAAQALVDPTRPPLELMRGATTGAAPRTPLQSILLSSARKGAILNGQYVPLGGAFGKATLVGITETEVTLKSDQGLEVLQLYPSLGKSSAQPSGERKTEKTAKRL